MKFECPNCGYEVIVENVTTIIICPNCDMEMYIDV